MEFLAVIAVLLIAFTGYKLLFKPNNSDKLTLLQMENWVSLYSNASLLEKGSMATALLVQAITLANNMGASITVNEFMLHKHKNKESSVEIANGWLEHIYEEMTKDISRAEIDSTPARTVCAMMVVKLDSPAIYRELLRG